MKYSESVHGWILKSEVSYHRVSPTILTGMIWQSLPRRRTETLSINDLHPSIDNLQSNVPNWLTSITGVEICLPIKSPPKMAKSESGLKLSERVTNHQSPSITSGCCWVWSGAPEHFSWVSFLAWTVYLSWLTSCIRRNAQLYHSTLLLLPALCLDTEFAWHNGHKLFWSSIVDEQLVKRKCHIHYAVTWFVHHYSEREIRGNCFT